MIVDTTGAVELTEPDTTTVVDPGITIVRDSNLPTKIPASASTAYAPTSPRCCNTSRATEP